MNLQWKTTKRVIWKGEQNLNFLNLPHAAKSEFFESLHRAREETKIRLFRLDLYARGKSAVLAVHQRAGKSELSESLHHARGTVIRMAG